MDDPTNMVTTDVGSSITRMQPRDYTLHATGWIRMVANVQSLLSVYLLSLWVLTYFGRLECPRIVYTDLNGLFCKALDGPLMSANDLGRLEEEG